MMAVEHELVINMTKTTRRQRIRKGILLLSFLLFPIFMNYFSFYVIMDAAAIGLISGSFVIFILMFIGSLFFGRAWCGWLCPAGGIQELCYPINDSKAGGGRGAWSKWVFWIPWFSLVIILLVIAGGPQGVSMFHLTEGIISVDEPMKYIMYYIALAMFLLPAVIIGRRAGCHHVCWMAPFMIIGRRIRNAIGWSSLQLEPNVDLCTNCKTCTRNCPMSLDVNEMVQQGLTEHSECILCGTCADVCPQKVITLSLNRWAIVGFLAAVLLFWFVMSWFFELGAPFDIAGCFGLGL